ncbi:hypothetical protein LSH36_876g00016 [Paralvinella palmiformis]|uniref:Uncharacterized protein n=1 Tax=Paralvinella palmiformis TaxID=53620 RepID=A0AAD9MTC4_9ANNE|nr:hypothetical protein LSH36_876g00016 [Paralvinella palmiformis]
MATIQERLRLAASRKEHMELALLMANTDTDEINLWRIKEIFRRRKERIMKEIDDPPDDSGSRTRKVSVAPESMTFFARNALELRHMNTTYADHDRLDLDVQHTRLAFSSAGSRVTITFSSPDVGPTMARKGQHEVVYRRSLAIIDYDNAYSGYVEYLDTPTADIHVFQSNVSPTLANCQKIG